MSLLLGVTKFCPATICGGTFSLGSSSAVVLVRVSLGGGGFGVFDFGLGSVLHSVDYALLAAMFNAWLPSGAAKPVAGVGNSLGNMSCVEGLPSFHQRVVWMLRTCVAGFVLVPFLHLLLRAPGGNSRCGMVLVSVSLS